MSSSHLDPLVPVLQSIQRGQLVEKLNTFSDAQLQPFLPFLVSTTFGARSDPSQTPPELLSRLVSFQRQNEILSLISVNFDKLKKYFTVPAGSQIPIPSQFVPLTVNGFSTATAVEKYIVIVGALLNSESEDILLHSFVSDDLLDAAAEVIALSIIHIPDCVSLKVLMEKLLAVVGGPHIVSAIVCNTPSLLQPILHQILPVSFAEETSRGKNRAQMVMNLVTLCPSITGFVVSSLSRSRRDALLAVKICAQKASDEFFVRYLATQFSEKKSIITAALRKYSARSVLAILSERIMQMVAKLAKSSKVEPNPELLSCIASIQLQCNYKLNAADVRHFIDYLTKKVGDDSHSVLALCSMIVLPCLVPTAPGSSIDSKIVDFVQWLKERATSKSQTQGAAERTILLTAMCLWAKKMDDLHEFLSEVLHTKVLLHQRQIDALHNMFKSVFSEKELATLCAMQPVTNNLHRGCGVSGLLPVQWILELITQGVFEKHGVKIAPWIERQINACSIPVHGAMVDVLEKFAFSAESVENRLGTSYVEETFNGPLLDEDRLVRRVLVLGYLLAFRSKYIHSGRKLTEIPFESTYRTLPLRYFLSLVESRHADFEKIRVLVTRHAIEMFPYMLPTTESVKLAGYSGKLKVSLSTEEASAVLCGRDTIAAQNLAQTIEYAPLSDLVRLLPSVVSATCTCFPSTSKEEPSSTVVYSQPLIDAVGRLWLKLEAAVPRLLVEQTIIAWLKGSPNVSCTISQLYEQPCLLFAADSRVFASPAHFACFLRILAFFLDASRTEAVLSTKAANVKQHMSPTRAEERDMLCQVLDHTQRTLAVQAMIEICDEKRNKHVGPGARLEAIRTLAFDHIHSMFIEDPGLLRMVLFETFPLHMVHTFVDMVPSVHISQVYIQEMFSLPDLKRRMFAVYLVVELFKKYRVISTFPIVQLMVNAVNTIVQRADCVQALVLMDKVVPVLADIAKVYPDLAEPISVVFSQVTGMAETRLAMNSHCLVSKKTLERRLITSITKELAGLKMSIV